MNNKKQALLLLGAGVVLGWSTSSIVRWARHQLLQLLFPLGPLQLSRPLVVFDIESTGLNVSKDRILEIAAVKVWPNGKVEVKGPQRLNPSTRIPEEVTAIHGISQEDLVGCPTFGAVAQEWRDFLQDCDLAGYNAKKFDVPILRNEFRRAGQYNFPPLGVPVVDAFRIFCQQEPRTLSAAVSFYCGRPYSKADAHSALGDAWATLKVLVEQVRRYGDLPQSVSGLSDMCARPSRAQDITPDSKFQWRGEQPIVAFGKHAGEPLAVLIARHKDHLMWMSGQDWGDESLLLVAQALRGLLPTKQGAWVPLFDTPAPERPAGNGSGSNSRPAREQQQQQPAWQQQQQEQQDAAAAGSPSATPVGDAGSGDTAAAAAAGGPSSSEAPSPPPAAAAATATPPQKPANSCAPPMPAPEFTGWPDLDAAATESSSADAAADAAASSAPSAAAAAAQNVDSWGAEPSTVADGWSLLETVNYGGNPEPQTPSAEPEGVGEGGGGGAGAGAGAAREWEQEEQEEEEQDEGEQGDGGEWQQQDNADNEEEEGDGEGSRQQQQQQVTGHKQDAW